MALHRHPLAAAPELDELLAPTIAIVRSLHALMATIWGFAALWGLAIGSSLWLAVVPAAILATSAVSLGFGREWCRWLAIWASWLALGSCLLSLLVLPDRWLASAALAGLSTLSIIWLDGGAQLRALVEVPPPAPRADDYDGEIEDL